MDRSSLDRRGSYRLHVKSRLGRFHQEKLVAVEKKDPAAETAIASATPPYPSQQTQPEANGTMGYGPPVSNGGRNTGAAGGVNSYPTSPPPAEYAAGMTGAYGAPQAAAYQAPQSPAGAYPTADSTGRATCRCKTNIRIPIMLGRRPPRYTPPAQPYAAGSTMPSQYPNAYDYNQGAQPATGYAPPAATTADPNAAYATTPPADPHVADNRYNSAATTGALMLRLASMLARPNTTPLPPRRNRKLGTVLRLLAPCRLAVAMPNRVQPCLLRDRLLISRARAAINRDSPDTSLCWRISAGRRSAVSISGADVQSKSQRPAAA